MGLNLKKLSMEAQRKNYCPFPKRECEKCNFYWENECVLKRAYIMRSESDG